MVANYLESLGHAVIVADPNFAPMHATRSRRVKTDRRDARTLADACRLGAYGPAHRLSAPQRQVRAELAVRDALVRTRTRYIALAKALIRRDGRRIPSGEADRRVAALVAADPVVRRLATAPGIGPVTATAYVATIDDVQRFPTAHHLEAYLGLAPSERSSGEKQQRGRITKAGNVRLRWLLVEAAWRVVTDCL